MIKKRGAALFIDLFIFFLFNSIVLRPYLEADLSAYNLKGLIFSISSFCATYFCITFFGKASPGGLFVGIYLLKDTNRSWFFSFVKKYSYALILFASMVLLLLQILPEASTFAESNKSVVLGDFIFSFSIIKIVGWVFVISFLIDITRAISSKSQQTFTELWARIRYTD